MDVWAILTDYDKLALHVPNLVESKITRRLGRGEQGDGQFRCRLFQRGAQKVFGFEFGASVTMDMKEVVIAPSDSLPPKKDTAGSLTNVGERRVMFKCFDSFFFSAFDGEWQVLERIGEYGQLETQLSYIVEVRPKGPVPVAALEWRIKEDVPVNLRAVKRAAMVVGYEGVMAFRPGVRMSSTNSASSAKKRSLKKGLLSDMKVKWYKDETMETYLSD
jgi:hypothetical protein